MKLYSLLFAVALPGCTTGRAEVDLTENNVVTFAGLPTALPQGQTLPTSTLNSDVTFDLQKDVTSLDGLGPLSADVSQNTLSGSDLSFLQHIEISIAPLDGSAAPVLLSAADVPASSTEIQLPILADSSLVLDELRHGKVNVHFTVTGNVSQPSITLTHTFVAHVEVAVSGSVLKL